MRLTESDRMVRDSLREFLDAEVSLALPDVDAEPVSKAEAIEYQQALGDLGGGPGAGDDAAFEDPVTYVVAMAEIARVCPSLMMIITMGFPFPAMLVPYAGDRTRKALAPRARAGAVIGSLAVTEPEGGSDTTSPSPTAVRDGDEFVLDGAKTWISNAPIADVILVFARDEDRDAPGFFLVDAETTSFETQELDKLGWNGSPTGQVFLDECRIPVANRLSDIVGEMAIESETAVLENPMFARMDPKNVTFA